MARSNDRIGEYRVVGEVSRTPVAITLDAVHLVLPRRALIKIVSAPTERLAVRALREPYFLETLEHPGIVRVYESALLPDRRPWFAREHVEGPTLATRMRPGLIDRADVIAILRDLADVLAHAHGRGVIHGGLRPERIVLTDRTRGFPLCLVDWSDARAHDAMAVAYVPSPGGWPYAAPELLAGESVDDRADVFALGVIAYQLLTGVMPVTSQLVPTEVRCPDAPRELTGMIDQMLSFDRWDRPSASDVRADLGWLGEAIATSMLRMRRPRWTPQIAMASVPDDDYDELEIGDDRSEQ